MEFTICILRRSLLIVVLLRPNLHPLCLFQGQVHVVSMVEPSYDITTI